MSADGTDYHLTTLSDLFRRTACLYPTRPALWVDGHVVTYAELLFAATQLASAISAVPSECDRQAEQQCGLLVSRSPTAYVSVLGALFAGSAYVPLNPRFPVARLLAILLASSANIVVVDRASTGVAESVIPACPRPLTVLLPDAARPSGAFARAHHHRFICRDEIARAPPASAPERQNADDGAYLLFTSGSTGAPKGVLIRHRNVLAYLHTVFRRYEPMPEDRFTQLFDFSFDLSAHDMFLCWSAGGCLYCPAASVLASPRDFVRRHALTFWFSVPSTAATMARLRMLEPGQFPTLRVSLFCGEALSTRLARMWQRAAPHSIVENLYGPTEATIAITAYRLPDSDAALRGRPIVPIGMTFAGQQALVIDSGGKPIPDGEPGELCVGGSQVANGYWHLPEVTAERFAPPLGLPDPGQQWYRTGDRVMKDSECGLVFLGRLDHQAKIRGHRVDLHEVEGVVREATDAECTAALAWPSGDAEPARYVVVFIAGEPRSTDSIIAHCRRKLPPVVVPRYIHFLSYWPVNANGKTDYAALRIRLEQGIC